MAADIVSWEETWSQWPSFNKEQQHATTKKQHPPSVQSATASSVMRSSKMVMNRWQPKSINHGGDYEKSSKSMSWQVVQSFDRGRRIEEGENPSKTIASVPSDDSSVSGVTDPSFFVEKKKVKAQSERRAKITIDTNAATTLGSLDVNSPVFSPVGGGGPMFLDNKHRSKTLTSPVNSDDFSDPSFPDSSGEVNSLSLGGPSENIVIDKKKAFSKSVNNKTPMPKRPGGTTLESYLQPNLAKAALLRKGKTVPSKRQPAVVGHALSSGHKQQEPSKSLPLTSPPSTPPPTINSRSGVASAAVEPTTCPTVITSLRSSSMSKRKSLKEKRFQAKKQDEGTSFENNTKHDAASVESKKQKAATKSKKTTKRDKYLGRFRCAIINPRQLGTKSQETDSLPELQSNGGLRKYEATLSKVEDTGREMLTSADAVHKISCGSLSSSGGFSMVNSSYPSLHMISTDSLSTVASDHLCRRSSLLRPSLNSISDESRLAILPHEEFPVYSEHSSDPLEKAALRMLSSAIVPIQAMIRGRLALNKALTRMWALVVIQAYVRGTIVRNKVLDMSVAATKIQAGLRGRWDRKRLALADCSAIEIQRHVRGVLARLASIELLRKITVIQSACRMHLATNEAVDRILSILTIQSAARVFIDRTDLVRHIKAAVRIQTISRGFLARLDYAYNLVGIVTIQCVWRRKLATALLRKLRALVSMQAFVRGYLRRTNLREMSFAATTIQARFRGGSDRERLARKDSCALEIQRHVRGMLTRLEAQEKLRKITVIQNTFRRHMAIAEAVDRILSAITIQSAARAFIARKDYVRHVKAVTAIQSIYRSFSRRLDYICILMDIVTIQCQWRRNLAVVRSRERRALVVSIQSRARAFIARNNYARHINAATAIQSFYRGFSARWDYEFDLMDIVTVQSVWRRKLALARSRELRALIAMQACGRGYLVRTHLLQLNVSAARIQAMLRGGWDREQLILEEGCAIELQRHVRCFLAMRDLMRKLQSIKIIQSMFRRKVATNEAVDRMGAIIQIQAVARTFIVSTQFARELKAAIIIQKAFRGLSARTSYYFDLMDVVLIQSVWRRTLAEIRVETMRLDNITQRALESLQTAVKKALRRTKTTPEIKIALVVERTACPKISSNYTDEKETLLLGRNEEELKSLVGEQRLVSESSSSLSVCEWYGDQEMETCQDQ